MEKHERIQKRMIALGLNQVDVIRLSKGLITRGSMSQYYNGKGFPDGIRLVTLCNILKTTENWLVFGKGIEDLRESDLNSYTFGYTPKFAPLIRWSDLEVWSTSKMEKIKPIETVQVDYEVSDDVFALKVESINMSPDINPGQTVLCDSSLEPKNGNYIIVKVNNSFVIRKLSLDGFNIYLKSTNPDWPSKIEELESKDDIFAVIVKVWKDLI